MPKEINVNVGLISRRNLFGAAAVALTAAKASAEACAIGPPAHEKGPKVWMDMDQVELNVAYDQSAYAPMINQLQARFTSSSIATRSRLGLPQRLAYGPTAIEALDLYPTRIPNAPIFIFIHGGRWLRTSAKDYGFPADLFVNSGTNFIALDFIQADAANGDLRLMGEQVRRGIAWVYRNAGTFGADSSRIYVGGHSSGGHLCGVALVTDWHKEFGLPANLISGGLLMSGLYDLKSARLSATRSAYIKFNDEMEQSMSSQRQIEQLRAPVTVTYGTNESPEFQRQSRDFAAAVKAAGKPVELIESPNFNHFEMCESLGNPYGPNGLAALKLIKAF
jgi:arylformamidase